MSRFTPPSLVIVIAYNSEPLMPDLLQTLSQWLTSDRNSRFVLINNSPQDNSLSIARASMRGRADQCLFVSSEQNQGFAPAVNSGLLAAKNKWGEFAVVVLLNPDVITSAETLQHLVGRVGNGVGVAAPILVAPGTGEIDRGVARRNWTRRSLLAEVAGVPRATRLLGAPLRNISVRAGSGPVSVDMTSGAFMAVEADLLENGLDTRVPMYFEDQELCHRAKSAGRAVVVQSDLTAVHLGGHSRKSHRDAHRDLRLLELAEAPALSIEQTKGVPLWQSRAVVGLGGAARIVGILPGALTARRSPIGPWAVEQARLGGWFISWSIGRPAGGLSVDLFR